MSDESNTNDTDNSNDTLPDVAYNIDNDDIKIYGKIVVPINKKLR